MKVGTAPALSTTQKPISNGNQHLRDLQRIRWLLRNTDTLTQTTIIELFKNSHGNSSFEVTTRLVAVTAKCCFINVITWSVVATPFWAILKLSDIFDVSFKYLPITIALFYLNDVSKPLYQIHAVMQRNLHTHQVKSPI